MRVLKMVLFAAALLMVSCNDKDDEFKVTPQFLYQTIWEGAMTSYSVDGSPSVTEGFVIEFVNKNEGKCNLQFAYEIQRFTYVIKDSVMTFRDSAALAGEWYIFEKSPEKIVLQQYTPMKLVLTLTKIY